MKNRQFVKLELRGKPPEEKYCMGGAVYNAMSKSPYFISPNPSLAYIAAVTDALKVANMNAAFGGVLQKIEQKMAIANFDDMMNRVGSYIQTIADEDPQHAFQIIHSAALDPRRTWAKKPTPSYTYLVPKFTYLPALIKLLIKGGRNAKRFDIYMSASNEDSATWSLIATTTKRSIAIKVPQRETLYYFKVISYNAQGRCPKSDAVYQIAL